MAWQTPKTDWTAADGVRDSDLNRLEGNILELYNKDAVRAGKTIYVDWSSGNDDAGLGTSASPFATITRAISSLAKNLNGLNVNIHVAPGTYSEALNFKGFHGGFVNLISTGATAAVTVDSLTIDNSAVSLSSIRLGATAAVGIAVTNNGLLYTTGNIATTGASIGINVTNGACVYIGGTLTASNASAIAVGNASQAYVGSVTGNITATTGGIAAYGSGSVRATTLTGGRVYTGSQSSTGNVLADAEV